MTASPAPSTLRLFVTATGTEIGKTVVTSQIVRQLRARSVAVEALKPVASGVDPGALAESDPGRILTALDRPVTEAEVDAICPWRFAAPLAPDEAARVEGRPPLELEPIVRFCRGSNGAEVSIVEGVGGVRVPVGSRFTVIDWILGLEARAVVVGGTYLGSISHLLSALDSLRSTGVPVAGVVLSQSAEEPMPVERTCAALAPFLDGIPLVVLPRLERPFEELGPDLLGPLGLPGAPAVEGPGPA